MPSRILHSARAIHHDAPNLVEVGAHLYALPTVSILTRLHNPDVSILGISFAYLLHYWVILDRLLLLLLALLAVPLVVRAVISRLPRRVIV